MGIKNLPHPDTVIIIFAREPVQGQVKTRLIPALGKEGATQLYRRLLDYTIVNAIAAALAPVNLCISPDSHNEYFSQRSDASQFKLSKQVGDDLGARMYHALAMALKHYSKALLIGSDCPFLHQDDFQQAIAALDTNDMVFSPARDGGYVLVGAKKVIPEVFNNIDWGTDKVMQQTQKILKVNKINWQELSEKCDIDIKSDLNYLMLHNDFKGFITD